jgi:hypothetical protein
MKCPVNFRGIAKDDWPGLMDALQRTLDELYRQDELRSREYVKDGQKVDAYLPALVLSGTVRNHKYRVGVNDSSPDAPVVELKDIGR